MKIFIMRHGQAEDIAVTTKEQDAKRALTKLGEAQAASMSSLFGSAALSHIWVSPYLRAQQTYQQVRKGLDVNSVDVTTNADITPYGNASSLHDYLDAVQQSDNISALLIVSHMPLVSYLVDSFTAGQQSPLFQTAAVAELDYDVETMKGELVAMHLPTA